ncbi:hypothetical protein A6A10_00005 [Otariodibacter oris]|nr:transferrin-binding protein-like solute binding protein [Otariodibacter oris]QGM81631.1 hypothetical protein A6A10_00005 [Otariodibacter oris]
MSDMISNNIGEIQKTFVNNNGTNGGRSNLSGAIISIKDGKFTQQNIDLETSNNINELVIDGKPITLFSNEDITNRRSEDQNSYNIYDIRSDNVTGKVGSLPKRAFDDNFAQLRYGYVKDNDGKITLFVQGHQTPVQGQIDTPFSYYWAGKNNNTEVLRALPKEGIWEYLGTAFYGKDQNYKELDTSAIVDITNKKVKVDVKENGTNKLTFGGNIEGNTFSGNYHGVESKGAFYGTNGIDIGGTFYQTQGNEKGYNGVFGATQQNCSWSGCAQLENKDALKDFNVSK